MSYTTIFTVGRMNPPTPGHFHLIEKMFEKAIENRVAKIHIILSSKTDCEKNPLEPEEKRYILETYAIPWIKQYLAFRQPHNKSMIENISVDILLSHEYSTIYSPNNVLETVRQLLLQKTKEDKILFVTGDGFPVGDRVDIWKLDRSEYPISGTLVREIARQSFPAFASIYQPFGICQKELYIIRRAILDLCPTNNEAVSKEARQYIRSRYDLRN